MMEKTKEQLLIAELDDEINQGHYQAVQKLLDQGANINEKDVTGNTPLMSAVWVGAVDIVRLLLKQGAQQDVLDKQGKTALQLVEEIVREGGGPGHYEAFCVLKEASANI